MGKPAARRNDLHICPKQEPGPVPHVGGPVTAGSSDVSINGMPAARVGDAAQCVGPPDKISSGSGSVYINGKPAARLSDPSEHGGKISLGSFNVFIGDGGISIGSKKTTKNDSHIDIFSNLSKNIVNKKNFKEKQTREQRLKDLMNDDKVSSIDRGWIKQEQNAINRKKRKHIRNPIGKVLAHERGREAAKGFGYEHAHLRTIKSHRSQHKFDNWGKKNKERLW